MRIFSIEYITISSQIQKQLTSTGVNVPHFEGVDVDLKLSVSKAMHATWLVKGKAF